MNWRAFLLENERKSARRQIDIKVGDRKTRIRMRDLFDFFKVIEMIGSNVNDAVFPERGMN